MVEYIVRNCYINESEASVRKPEWIIRRLCSSVCLDLVKVHSDKVSGGILHKYLFTVHSDTRNTEQQKHCTTVLSCNYSR